MKGRTSMTVRHMYIFKTVCECQSITAAAGKLNIPTGFVNLSSINSDFTTD